jgi:hypothetical protein
MFADIQIITGVAILVSGYLSLRCGLSTYHWQLVVDLAWFSSVTHLSTLTFLRHYLHNRPKEKRLRVVAMLALLVLLSVAVGPTAHFAWLHETDAEKLALLKVQSSSHTICVYKLRIDTASPALQSMVVTVCLLVHEFAIRVAELSPRFGNRLRVLGSRLKERSIRMKARWEPNVGGSKATIWRTMVVEPLCIAGLQFLHVQLDLFCSVFAEVSLPRVTKRIPLMTLTGTYYSLAGVLAWNFRRVGDSTTDGHPRVWPGRGKRLGIRPSNGYRGAGRATAFRHRVPLRVDTNSGPGM